MQNNTKGSCNFEKHFNDCDRYPRRMSVSGFEYPNDLSNAQHPLFFSSIPETKYPNNVPLNMLHMVNGDYDKRHEVSSQNFFSENSVNQLNRTPYNTMTANSLDPRYNYDYHSSIPRHSSTPLIELAASKNVTVNERKDAPSSLYNQSCTPSSNYRLVNTQTLPGDNSQSCVQSSFVVYDHRTNSYQNVLFYSPIFPSINSEQNVNEAHRSYYSQSLMDDCPMLGNMQYQAPLDRREDYMPRQSNMTQQHREQDSFHGLANDDLFYYLPPEFPNYINEANRTESQSMPSLHGADSDESEFDSSDEDQLNTVHGEDMLHELQKLSSVFTNVVNLPMPRHDDVIGSAVYPCHSNLSRFKKTRIKERTTFWRTTRFIVKDNLVKIIPDKVLSNGTMNMDGFEQFEMDTFGCLLSSQTETQTAIPDPPDCVHSAYRHRSTPVDRRYLKHSSRSNQKYRSSFNSHSPIDLNNCSNQPMSSNISSRLSHRKSMQIPLRIPVVWNPIIPLLSPAVQHRNRMFFDPPSGSGKNSRRKRRWSLSGTKFDKNGIINSVRSQNVRLSCDENEAVKIEPTNEFFGNICSFDVQDFDDGSGVLSSQICALLESKIDKQLVALKKTLMSCVEDSLSGIRNKILSLKDSQTNLESELNFYKVKVQQLELSVRQNVPHDQWDLYGMTDHS